MRIAIFGDVHGNLPALEAMVRDLRTTTPDLLVCLGDLVDGFGHPRESVELVRSLDPSATVLGNAEWRVREWPASIATMRPNQEVLFRWHVDELGAENRGHLMYAGRMDALYALLDREADGWRVTWRDLDYDKRAAADSLARGPIVTPFMADIAARLRAEAT